MSTNRILGAVWCIGWAAELFLDPVHSSQHLDRDVGCLTYWVTMLSGLAYLASWVFEVINRPVDEEPAQRDRPSAKPSNLGVAPQPIPQERYYAAFTNDPNVDLKPKARDRG